MPTSPILNRFEHRVPVTFEEIISGWDHQPGCEMDTRNRHACRRPARWRIRLHGCDQVLACGQHAAAWVRGNVTSEAAGRLPQCAICGRVFPTAEAAYEVTEL